MKSGIQKAAKHKKRLFLCILIIAVAVAVAVASAVWKGFTGKKREEVPFGVTVNASGYTGQGVVYRQQEDKLYIVTAGHVLDALADGAACRIAFGEEEREAAVLYRSETADVAFLEVHMDGGENVLQAVPVSRERFDSLTEGDELWAAAVLDGTVERTEGELLYFWVYLEDFSLNMMLAKMDCRAGMSGCAILEENGYFTGILCGVSETGEAAVLPYSIIESEWILMAERGILK